MRIACSSCRCSYVFFKAPSKIPNLELRTVRSLETRPVMVCHYYLLTGSESPSNVLTHIQQIMYAFVNTMLVAWVDLSNKNSNRPPAKLNIFIRKLKFVATNRLTAFFIVFNCAVEEKYSHFFVSINK